MLLYLIFCQLLEGGGSDVFLAPSVKIPRYATACRLGLLTPSYNSYPPTGLDAQFCAALRPTDAYDDMYSVLPHASNVQGTREKSRRCVICLHIAMLHVPQTGTAYVYALAIDVTPSQIPPLVMRGSLRERAFAAR